MANHKSAAKRARQAPKRQLKNTQIVSSLKTWEKKIRTAVASKDAKTANELLRTVASKFDKAAQKGVIHTRTASRKLGRISKQISALK